jgi:serine/threonine protein kinase
MLRLLKWILLKMNLQKLIYPVHFLTRFKENLVNFQREIEILEKVDHVSFPNSIDQIPPQFYNLTINFLFSKPNIVKFFESFEDEDFIWIVLELVDRGE